jgi:hypothetical protein
MRTRPCGGYFVLVILVTAREMEVRHEHRAHEEGTPQEAVAALRAKRAA